MRIACVDKSAADRIRLQQYVETTYQECRSAIGHIANFKTYPATRDEILLNSAPDLVIIGSAFSIEEAYLTARDLQQTAPKLDIFILLTNESYTLRNFKRLGSFATDIFSIEEPAIRLVHQLFTLEQSMQKAESGQLVVVDGVKGGVGTTSIVSGLTHAAAAANGKSSIVVDLSTAASFIHYMAANRSYSADYAGMLSDHLFPDWAAVQRCITEAPNAVKILLPPAGGADMRELWLRDIRSFEITLSMIELLKEHYTYIFVDLARVEGVLAYALTTKADEKFLVTSGDPASVHLLNSKINTLVETPGDGDIKIILNNIQVTGLSRDDILDYMVLNERFSEDMFCYKSVPYDASGANWIGTGNTFYTESSRSTQKVLERLVDGFSNKQKEEFDESAKTWSLFNSLGNIKKLFINENQVTPPLALPAITFNETNQLSLLTVAPEEIAFFEAPKKVSNA